MMKLLLKSASLLTAMITFFAIAPLALAKDSCDNFSADPRWQVNFEHLQNEVFDKNYEAAVESAKVLFEICPRSPAVNYYTGLALQGLGENSRAMVMFQKASEYTTEFSTAPEMSRLIWYARYEAENPQSSADAQIAQAQKIRALEAELETQKMAAVQYETQLNSSETLQYVVLDNEREAFKKKYATLMWTGTGIGAIGLASTIAGAVLAFGLEDKDKYEDITNNDDSSVREYKIRPRYSAGLALFGTGLALTVSGALMAGFGGYHFTHSTDTVSFKLDISPNYTGLHMTF